MAWVKKAPAAWANLQGVTAAQARAQAAYDAELLSPAYSANQRALLFAKANRHPFFSRSGKRHWMKSGRARWMAAKLKPFNDAEAARRATKLATLTAQKARHLVVEQAFYRAKLEDRAAVARAAAAKYAAEQRAIRAKQAAADRALMQQRSQRLSQGIINNTKVTDLNSNRISNAQTLIAANRNRVSTMPVLKNGNRLNTTPVLTNAEKAALAVEKNLANKTRKMIIESKVLAIVDQKMTDAAAVDRAAIFGLSKKKNKALPPLAGAALGFKLGGIQGAAIGAAAGFMMNKGGA